MKKILHLFIFCFLSFSLMGQKILLEPEMTEFFFDSQDLTEDWLDLEKHITVTNNTDQPMNIKWVRTSLDDCPNTWGIKVCDNNTCYTEAVFSNYEPPMPAPAPFVLAAGESFDGFIFHVLPHGSAGCCAIQVEFYDGNDPDNELLATAQFDVRVNDPDCSLVDVDEITKASLKVYPNPMTDYFFLDGNEQNVVKNLNVYNVIGRQVKSFNAMNQSSFDMSGLPQGIYLVSMLGEDNEILKTVRISRQFVTP